jgi:hypothetical protein
LLTPAVYLGSEYPECLSIGAFGDDGPITLKAVRKDDLWACFAVEVIANHL